MFVTGGLKSIGAGLGPGGTPMQNQANLGFSGMFSIYLLLNLIWLSIKVEGGSISNVEVGWPLRLKNE